jgi:hypothetical protein
MVNFNLEEITLYHGTSTELREDILKEGLLPREKTGISNYTLPEMWGMSSIFESFSDRVYFAKDPERAKSLGNQATEVHGGEVIVFEAKVNVNNLVPDEDSHKKNWYDSLKEFGTVAYQGSISPEKIDLFDF